MNNIIILFILLNSFCVIWANKSYVVYVDSTSLCKNDCGSNKSPFSNLQDALDYVSKNDRGWDFFDWKFDQLYDQDIPLILVNPGKYIGEKNKNINIDFSVQIQGILGSKATFLDCQLYGNALSVKSSSYFNLKGMTIQNCHSNFGGALNLTSTNANIEDVIFNNNNASYGGAISIYQETAIIRGCKFTNNLASEYGGALSVESSAIVYIENSQFSCNSKYDISSRSLSSVIVESDTVLTQMGIYCNSSGTLTQDDVSKCGATTKCTGSTNTNNTTTPDTTLTFICKKDGICDLRTENCFSCPEDCSSCKFEGFKLVTYKGLIKSLNDVDALKYQDSIQQLPTPQVLNFMDDNPCPVSGQLSGYIKVVDTGSYQIRVTAFNIGMSLYINSRVEIDQYFQQDQIQTTRTIKVSSAYSNSLDVLFFSTSANERNLTVEWRKSNQDEWSPVKGFYSLNSCNDGVLDPQEKIENSPFYCSADVDIFYPKGQEGQVVEGCGDGICNEVPETCLKDCYQLISETCGGKAPVYSTPYVQNVDTIGTLLNNQYLYTLPGLHHLRHGIDFKSGKQKTSMLFSFDYCDNSSFSIIQDFYRGLVYTIPKELYATMSPQCNFETSTQVSSRASDFSESMSEKYGIDVSASVGGGTSFVKASVSLAFSEEESVEKSKQLSRAESGSLAKTDILCQSSKVHFSTYKFSQSFLKDISVANTVEQFKKLIEKYGSFYYKSATLGGSLSQTSVIKKSSSKTYSSEDISKHTERSFQASVSSKIFSVSASYSDSLDSSIKGSQQQEYEDNSKRSNLVIKGGAAGSFAPGDESSDFTEWAAEIDLIPVPVDFKLGYISDIIPKTWKAFNSSISVNQFWQDAEDEILNDLIQKSDIPNKRNVSRNSTDIQVNFSPSFNPGSLTYQYSKIVDGVVQIFTESQSIGNNSQEIKIPALNEILSLSWSSDSTSDSNTYNLRIQDFSSDRFYFFNNIVSGGVQKAPEFAANNILLGVSFNEMPKISHYLEITIQGTSSNHAEILNFDNAIFHLAGQQIVYIPITTNGYIGKIVSIQLKYWGSQNNLFTIKGMEIYQSCPAPNDISGCTPSSLFEQKNIYVSRYKDISTFSIKSYQQVNIPIY